MTRQRTSLAIGVWLLTGGVAIAAQPPGPLGAEPSARLVADGDFTATKDKYVEQARDQLSDWRRKLDEVADKAGAQARSSSAAAQRDLDAAWRKTQAAEGRLEGASQDGWERVKISFEKASRDLKNTWSRVHPDSK
ncbi:MAG: hypothetical protein WDO24_18440 [Pseudomonadota bacterium]